MKTSLKLLVLLSLFTFSCSQSYKTVPIDGTSAKIKIYERDRVDKSDYSDGRGELMLGGKKKVRVIYEKIGEKKFPDNLDFLVKSLGQGKAKDKMKITEKHTLSNGVFGITYINNDKPEKKHYVFYSKKGSEYIRFTNNEYYNTDLKHFDYVKSVMASIQ
ncbi:hypothetical protein BKI52_32135 [marine bacterium AO1-C]|nr:hypothetical protein BKI52_32135 [marine bacterium AO1-C]